MCKPKKSTDIEIKLNTIRKLGKCVVCQGESQDPFYGGNNQTGVPNLFVKENKWICIFCAKLYVPQLTSIIELARAAEAYSSLIFREDLGQESLLKSENLESQFSVNVDKVITNFICGICKEEEVELLVPEDEYEPGLPNLYINDSPVCYDCTEMYAPIFNRLMELSNKLSTFSFIEEFFPTFNKNQNPVLGCLVNEIGWVTCPNCKKYFSVDDFHRLRYNRHITCGQKLQLVFS